MITPPSDATSTPSAAGGGASDRTARAKSEAFRWLALLSSGRATDADAKALQDWCREDPVHQEAYAKAALVWDLMTPIAQASAKKATEAAHLPVARGADLGRRAFLGGALAASVGAAVYGAVYPPFGLWPGMREWRADVRTGTGETRRITLAKDIGVELNTRSSLAFRTAAADSHRIELISGEAIVTAGSANGAACTLIAGSGQIFARDAKVDVRYDGRRALVTCLDGNIQVTHAGRSVDVAASEQIAYDVQRVSEIAAADTETIVAWQKGLLIFRQKPLSDVIDEVNRYRTGDIILLNQNLGLHLIDARFRLDHLENFVTYLRQAFDARVIELPGGVVLVS